MVKYGQMWLNMFKYGKILLNMVAINMVTVNMVKSCYHVELRHPVDKTELGEFTGRPHLCPVGFHLAPLLR